jgi:hypothetical protein
MGDAIRISAILISLAGLAFADIDFTPRVQEYDLDGVKLSQLVFADGNQNVTYAPPRKWEYSGGGNRLVLHPSESPAEAVITTTKLARPEALDDSVTKRLRDDVLASVPSGATNITLVSQQLNPLLIERKETFRVVVSYDCFGESFARSVMFLNRQNEQVRFQLTCARRLFERLEKAFESSHYSWQNL